MISLARARGEPPSISYQVSFEMESLISQGGFQWEVAQEFVDQGVRGSIFFTIHVLLADGDKNLVVVTRK